VPSWIVKISADKTRLDDLGGIMLLPKFPRKRLMFFLVGCAVGLTVLASAAKAQTLVGGPCQYADFPGQATVTAVGPQAEPDQGLSYAGLAVTFTFAPDRPIAGEPLYVPGKVHHLTLAGGRAPGQRFVDKYKLRPGLVLPCRLRIIRQGTCTPVLFDFPGLDLANDIDFSKQ
jgi:hypothetical protein